MLQQALRHGPGNVAVGHAVDQPQGAGERQGAAQHELRAAFLDQPEADRIGFVAIFRGLVPDAVAQQRPAHGFGELVPHQVLGEVRGGGQADQAGDALRPGQGRQQHQPAAHARPHQDLRAGGQAVESQDRIGRPAADGAVDEPARGCAVPAIVEAQEGAAGGGTMRLQRPCLGAGHVRHEAAEEHDTGAGAVRPAIGQALAPLFDETVRFDEAFVHLLG